MNSDLVERQLTVPGPAAVEQAEHAAAALRRFLGNHPAPDSAALSISQDESGITVRIPAEVLGLVTDILAAVSAGDAVTVTPVGAELTTQQAADLLDVSRPYFVKLLEEGRLPFRRVGNRRRVLLRDVLEYQRDDAAYRRSIADALTAEAQHLGLDY